MNVMTNDTASKPGTTPLPDGIVRVFRDNGRGGVSYLAQQPIKYIPIGDKIELNLGPDPEVVFELIKQRSWRDTIWMQLHGVNVFRRIDGPGGVAVEANSTIAGWNDHQLFVQRIRNYTRKAIEVEVRRTFGGDVTFRSRLEPKLFDYQTVEFTKSLEPGKKTGLAFEVVTRQG